MNNNEITPLNNWFDKIDIGIPVLALYERIN